MFSEIFEVLKNLIFQLVEGIMDIIIAPIFSELGYYSDTLLESEINLVLFSDTPILSTNLYNLIMMVFTVFFTVFFIILLYKTTKKVIKSVFGVLKWW